MTRKKSGNKNSIRDAKQAKSNTKKKSVVQSKNYQDMNFEDFLNFDLKPCEKQAKLNQILSCIEYMVNILLYSMNQTATIIKTNDISAITQIILKPMFQRHPSWKALSKSLPLARNYVRHLPFSAITDNELFKQKVSDCNENSFQAVNSTYF